MQTPCKSHTTRILEARARSIARWPTRRPPHSYYSLIVADRGGGRNARLATCFLPNKRGPSDPIVGSNTAIGFICGPLDPIVGSTRACTSMCARRSLFFDRIQWIPLWDPAGLVQFTPFRVLPVAGVCSHSAVWIV